MIPQTLAPNASRTDPQTDPKRPPNVSPKPVPTHTLYTTYIRARPLGGRPPVVLKDAKPPNRTRTFIASRARERPIGGRSAAAAHRPTLLKLPHPCRDTTLSGLWSELHFHFVIA
jgi:hypothetical protein